MHPRQLETETFSWKDRRVAAMLESGVIPVEQRLKVCPSISFDTARKEQILIPTDHVQGVDLNPTAFGDGDAGSFAAPPAPPGPEALRAEDEAALGLLRDLHASWPVTGA